jgi:hypothetical protein
MKIIYQGINDGFSTGLCEVLIPSPKFLATLTGTDEEKMIHIANKDLPTGTKYEIIADSVDISDRTFRDAWEYTSNAAVEKTSSDLTAEQLVKYNMTENR